MHLETNGTLGFSPVTASPHPFDWVTVSPKPPKYYISPNLIFHEIKIVVDGPEALDAAMRLGSEHYMARMCLQPVSNSQPWLKRCIKFLHDRVASAMHGLYSDEQRRWRLSVQVHKLLKLR
jgi:organic radical activating enzyme